MNLGLFYSALQNPLCLHVVVYKIVCRNSRPFGTRKQVSFHRTRFTLKYCSHYSNLVNNARVRQLKETV